MVIPNRIVDKKCAMTSFPIGDALSLEKSAQSIESTFEQGTDAEISDNGLKDDVVDIVVKKNTVPVKGVEVRNTFGDLVGWLNPDVTAPQPASHRRIFGLVTEAVETSTQGERYCIRARNEDVDATEPVETRRFKV